MSHPLVKLVLMVVFIACCSESASPRDGASGRDMTPITETSRPGQEVGSPREIGPGVDTGMDITNTFDGQTGVGLASKYPGDDGIEQDPNVVFVENFEEGSVANVLARYDDHKNQDGMTLISSVPAKSSGNAALQLKAGGSNAATDFYTRLMPGYDKLYMRYYAKYDSGVEWHHTGVWIGGYNPATTWPSPKAGIKPSGDDRFSVSIEPMGSGSSPGPQLDFYNYWMKMHSHNDSEYWGNTLLHQNSFQVDTDQWMCIEILIKLNPSTSSGAGAELAVWKNDELIQHFTDNRPLGYWLKDKFCPEDADHSSCTNYPPAPGTQMIPLDLQYRNASALKINYFWPQNYITSGPEGSVTYDDIVIATVRVGCLQ